MPEVAEVTARGGKLSSSPLEFPDPSSASPTAFGKGSDSRHSLVSFLGVGFGGEISALEGYRVTSSTASSLSWFFSKNLLSNKIHTIKKYLVLTVELRMQFVDRVGH